MQTDNAAKLTFTDKINQLIQVFQETDDTRALEQLAELSARGTSTTRLVALVGLFSAGKSTLINTLTHSGLATGAVPTTAVVAEVELPGSDGTVHLLDTPGVDSTDDAHRDATEAALYQADAVLLVMDYQHVEADENLELASGFATGAKRLVIVVNQVDKHLDFELPFATFQHRVESSIQDWDIQYEHIFYTASRPSPYNQLEQLRSWLTGLADDGNSAQDMQAKRVREIIRDHVERQFQPQFEQLADIAEPLHARDVLLDPQARKTRAASLMHERDDLAARLDDQRSTAEERLGEQRVRFARMVDLAQISPYETTELGRFYVESMRPAFRVGWLGSAAKTEAERKARLDRFLDDLNDRTTRYLCWSVQGELRQEIQSEPLLASDWLGRVETLTAAADESLCEQLMNHGALSSEQYPYQYVKDVVARVKGQFTTRMNVFLHELDATAMAAWADMHADDLDELRQLEQQLAPLLQFAELEQAREQAILRLEQLWEEPQ